MRWNEFFFSLDTILKYYFFPLKKIETKLETNLYVHIYNGQVERGR